MATKGHQVVTHSVSEQPHELAYEARKEGTSAKNVEDVKKATHSSQRSAVKTKLETKK